MQESGYVRKSDQTERKREEGKLSKKKVVCNSDIGYQISGMLPRVAKEKRSQVSRGNLKGVDCVGVDK